MNRLDLDLNPRIAAGVRKGELSRSPLNFRLVLNSEHRTFEVILPNMVYQENKTA